MAAPDAPGFDASAFRTGIQFAMNMGLDPDDGAVFIMAPAVDPDDTTVDAQGVPWDPDEVGTLPDAGLELSATCGLEFFDSAGVTTAGIETETAKVVATLLDADWLPVADCIAIRLGDRIYQRHHKRPPLGMFTVGVHQAVFVAGDI